MMVCLIQSAEGHQLPPHRQPLLPGDGPEERGLDQPAPGPGNLPACPPHPHPHHQGKLLTRRGVHLWKQSEAALSQLWADPGLLALPPSGRDPQRGEHGPRAQPQARGE